MKKKEKKKVTKKSPKKTTHEIVVRVAPQEPTKFLKESDLEPIKEGGKFMIPKTWVSERQVLNVIGKTPAQFVYKRKGRGGQSFDYVTGHYITKALNFIFGWNWDFEIISHGKEGDQVWVQGKLTVKDDKGHSITKSQFGRADVKFMKGTKNMVDFGNDLKAASTDALKKCASLLGIASDVYGKMEYKEDAGFDVQTNKPANLPSPKETVVTPDHDHDMIDYVCSNCGEDITKQEAEFSLKVYKKMLCRNDQKALKK